jgi:hypothetical protein
LQKTILSLRLEIQTLQSQILELKRPTALQEHELLKLQTNTTVNNQLLVNSCDIFIYLESLDTLVYLQNRNNINISIINIFTGI